MTKIASGGGGGGGLKPRDSEFVVYLIYKLFFLPIYRI